MFIQEMGCLRFMMEYLQFGSKSRFSHTRNVRNGRTSRTTNYKHCCHIYVKVMFVCRKNVDLLNISRKAYTDFYRLIVGMILYYFWTNQNNNKSTVRKTG